MSVEFDKVSYKVGLMELNTTVGREHLGGGGLSQNHIHHIDSKEFYFQPTICDLEQTSGDFLSLFCSHVVQLISGDTRDL